MTEETQTSEETEEEKRITEQIELLSGLMDVKSSLKKNITSDYPLAFLNVAEKDFITENYENGEFAQELISRFADKGYFYKWDDNKGDWDRDAEDMPKRHYLSQQEKKLIGLRSKRIFTFFMIRSHLIAILGRNKADNFLVKLLGKHDDDSNAPATYSADDKNVLQKLKEKLSGENVNEEE